MALHTTFLDLFTPWYKQVKEYPYTGNSESWFISVVGVGGWGGRVEREYVCVCVHCV